MTQLKSIHSNLSDAIDDGLRGALGESGRLVLFCTMESRFKITREEIPNKLELLHNVRTERFGSGAAIIETNIIKSLCEKLRLEFKQRENLTLVEYVKSI